jgi:hypothetical protein
MREIPRIERLLLLRCVYGKWLQLFAAALLFFFFFSWFREHDLLLPLRKLKKGRQASSELKPGRTQTDKGDGDGEETRVGGARGSRR